MNEQLTKLLYNPSEIFQLQGVVHLSDVLLTGFAAQQSIYIFRLTLDLFKVVKYFV